LADENKRKLLPLPLRRILEEHTQASKQ